MDYKCTEPARGGTHKNNVIMQCSAAGFGFTESKAKPIIPVLHINQNESLSLISVQR